LLASPISLSRYPDITIPLGYRAIRWPLSTLIAYQASFEIIIFLKKVNLKKNHETRFFPGLPNFTIGCLNWTEIGKNKQLNSKDMPVKAFLKFCKNRPRT
jgi:hypothetical protein